MPSSGRRNELSPNPSLASVAPRESARKRGPPNPGTDVAQIKQSTFHGCPGDASRAGLEF
jgi:hypothetical protein